MSAGVKAGALDPEGKFFLLKQQLELGRWEAAGETLDAVSDEDRVQAPVLYHITAITRLLSAVPAELRSVVVNQLPLDAANFPLASDAPSMDARRTAQHLFADAAEAARKLKCPRVATLGDEYALWLELRNPETEAKGRKRLEERLRDPKFALQLVPLGLQFGLKLDLPLVEQVIDQQIALHGGITPEAAMARFALMFTQKSPKDVANYIEHHYDALSKVLEKKFVVSLQMQLLSRTGMSDKAEQRLSFLLEDGLSEEDEGRLRRIIAEAAGADPVEVRKEQFGKTDALSDLVALVDELEATRNWAEPCEFGEVLFQGPALLSMRNDYPLH